MGFTYQTRFDRLSVIVAVADTGVPVPPVSDEAVYVNVSADRFVVGGV